MLKKVLIALAVVVVVLLAVIAKQPEDFNVSKSLAMDAAKADIFPHINNLHNWNAWSPWAKIDPNAQTSFEGAEAGVGAIMKWSSDNNEVGEGSMKIVGGSLNESVRLELEMTEPVSATNVIEFTLKEVNEKQTVVTWTMTGKKGFVAKAMGLFHDCAAKVGEKFDEGLNNLRKVVETKNSVVEAAPAAVETTGEENKPVEEIKIEEKK